MAGWPMQSWRRVALPGIFPPKCWQEYYLVDGGLLDPVPVAVARSLAPDLPVVAVVLSNLDPEPLKIMESLPFLPDIPLLRQITRLRVAQAFNVFMHSIDISSQYLTTMRLKIEQPEVVIQPAAERYRYVRPGGFVGDFETAEKELQKRFCLSCGVKRAGRASLDDIFGSNNWQQSKHYNLMELMSSNPLPLLVYWIRIVLVWMK